MYIIYPNVSYPKKFDYPYDITDQYGMKSDAVKYDSSQPCDTWSRSVIFQIIQQTQQKPFPIFLMYQKPASRNVSAT